MAKAQKRTGVTTVNLDMNLAEAQLLATLLDRVAGHHECTNYKRLRGL